ncbi:MAG: adenylyl-sulfate kinase [Terriglobales bacterium]
MRRLQFLTCGAVDDGKSTLVGRLLYECGCIYRDQLDGLRRPGTTGPAGLELAWVTDGLRAEREHGVTMDVAYRYFSTVSRSYVLADAPGHEEFARGLATAASNADLALLLVDATRGATPQTLRHALTCAQLGASDFIIAVNKMDLVGYDEGTFESLAETCLAVCAAAGGARSQCLPVSALAGDNVTAASARLSWWHGPTLLAALELARPRRREEGPFRMAVQAVLAGPGGERRYAGRVARGTLRRGASVATLPAGRAATAAAVYAASEPVRAAQAGRSIEVVLDPDPALARGAVIAMPPHPPVSRRAWPAKLVWLCETPTAGGDYIAKHWRGYAKVRVQMKSRINGNCRATPAASIGVGELGAVGLEFESTELFDPYARCRASGSLVLLAAGTCETVGAAMIEDVRTDSPPPGPARDGLLIWLTGLCSSGKSTLARIVARSLRARGHTVYWLDGDQVRGWLSPGLGFTRTDRDENVRRIGELARRLNADSGATVVVSAVSPYREARAEVRSRAGRFLEVYVDAPLSVCAQRDTKGLYRRAAAGELAGLTGVDDPYETPVSPEVLCPTSRETPEVSAARILAAVDRLSAPGVRSSMA